MNQTDQVADAQNNSQNISQNNVQNNSQSNASNNQVPKSRTFNADLSLDSESEIRPLPTIQSMIARMDDVMGHESSRTSTS